MAKSPKASALGDLLPLTVSKKKYAERRRGGWCILRRPPLVLTPT